VPRKGSKGSMSSISSKGWNYFSLICNFVLKKLSDFESRKGSKCSMSSICSRGFLKC
jgi:hypothetical protein